MSSLNPAWLIAEAVKTELDAAFANPTAILADADFGTFSPQSIAVIAPGAEDNRPGAGARSWVNIYVPEDLALTWETGNSYLAKPIIRVSVFVEETKRLRGSLHETCLSLSHFITVCLTRSTLNSVARRAPKQTGANTYRQKGETQTWVGEVKLEYEYQGRGAPVDWSKTVPDCDGLTEAAANAAITAAGLTPDSDGAFSATVAKGLVINQSPAAGTALYAGDVVTITVSFGVERNTVPVTKDLLPAAAEAALIAAGLVLGTSTSEMTDDTEAGLVASSSPAAGTGVAAGTAVNLTVSLGDLHTRIPINVVPGRTANVMVTTTGGATFYYLLPDGSTVAGTSGVYYSSYTAPLGATDAIIYCVMNTGYTTAQIIGFEGESGTNGARFCLDYLKHIRVSAAQRLWLNPPLGGVYGDIANLASSLVAGSTIYLNVMYAQDGIYGDLSALPPLSLYNCYYWTRVYGALTPHSTCAIIRMLNVFGPSFADISQTIINWNAANPATFARTGIFNLYKRSQLTAAGEAAVVALIAKGCTFTFKAE